MLQEKLYTSKRSASADPSSSSLPLLYYIYNTRTTTLESTATKQATKIFPDLPAARVLQSVAPCRNCTTVYAGLENRQRSSGILWIRIASHYCK